MGKSPILVAPMPTLPMGAHRCPQQPMGVLRCPVHAHDVSDSVWLAMNGLVQCPWSPRATQPVGAADHPHETMICTQNCHSSAFLYDGKLVRLDRFQLTPSAQQPVEAVLRVSK